MSHPSAAMGRPNKPWRSDNRESQTFSLGYGSILPTSLTYMQLPLGSEVVLLGDRLRLFRTDRRSHRPLFSPGLRGSWLDSPPDTRPVTVTNGDRTAGSRAYRFPSSTQNGRRDGAWACAVSATTCRCSTARSSTVPSRRARKPVRGPNRDLPGGLDGGPGGPLVRDCSRLLCDA